MVWSFVKYVFLNTALMFINSHHKYCNKLILFEIEWSFAPSSVCFQVSIIEPGNYIAGTNIFSVKGVRKLGDSMWREMPDQVKEDYGKDLFEKKVSSLRKRWLTLEQDLRHIQDNAFIAA